MVEMMVATTAVKKADLMVCWLVDYWVDQKEHQWALRRAARTAVLLARLMEHQWVVSLAVP